MSKVVSPPGNMKNTTVTSRHFVNWFLETIQQLSDNREERGIVRGKYYIAGQPGLELWNSASQVHLNTP